jgi:hypothetical protein
VESSRPGIFWALGRLGARQPVYGPLNTVVPGETAVVWLKRLIDFDCGDSMPLLAVMQTARRTGDRYRDVPDKLRTHVLDWLARHDAPSHFIQLVREVGQLDAEEQGLVFGEALPKGLRIV